MRILSRTQPSGILIEIGHRVHTLSHRKGVQKFRRSPPPRCMIAYPGVSKKRPGWTTKFLLEEG